jgi:hypothetical protein
MKLQLTFTHHVYTLKIKDLGPLNWREKTLYRRAFAREFGAKNIEFCGWLISLKRNSLNAKKGTKNAWQSLRINEA